METISIIGYGLLIVALAVLPPLAVRDWLSPRHKGGVVPPGERTLSDREVMVDLTAFLRKQNVVGDADIRDGVVFPPVPPEKLDPLAVVLGNAAVFINRLRNPAACSLYVRDSMSDRFMLLPDLDLDHLLDASRVMQRVAEDRRKSRSLYKGLTDDEMMTERLLFLKGPPVTPELQQVFGYFGKVSGLATTDGTIHVQYESGVSVRFNPERN